ncbi:MAG: lysophospholipid acyltransferase family protein [Planctomycetota bacterium]|jgi:1-acyl-sn-glycerol-3-phosphate acyltransferase
MSTPTLQGGVKAHTPVGTASPRLRAGTFLIQQFLGVFCYLFVVLPYVRRIKGRFPKKGNRLYVCNHVSLLDTMVLGGAFWSRRRLPLLVLGDKKTWHKNRVRRMLSARVGYLIERGRITKEIAGKLSDFAHLSAVSNILVFPEGTRGDGVNVKKCQPGIYHVAREAGVPVVPVFLESLQKVSTKSGPLHLLRGLRKVTIHIGQEFDPTGLDRDALLARVREAIAGAKGPGASGA